MYVLADGSTAEAAVIGREGMLGLSAVFGSPPPSYWTRVTIAGSALRVSAEVLRKEFGRGGALQRLLLGYAGDRMAQISQRAVCNGRHKVESRFCTWLLMMRDRVSEDHLPLTHEQISLHLGARRAGITNAAIALRNMRIISYSHGLISILDRKALESFACECFRALK